MMNFITADREQPYLLPPSLQEWLPENHLAWFILDAVDQMNLRAFYKGYREDGRGGAAFEPSMMVSLLLYAYCVGERSSRRLERLCETDVAFRVIMANLNPDHATIARFRRNQRKELNRLFVEILRLCREAGLVKMGTVALDGTKIKANAALDANRTHDGLEAEVEKMLSEAETKDQEEDKLYEAQRGDEVPEKLRGKSSRLARLKECRARLEREAAKKAAEQERKIREREDEKRIRAGLQRAGRGHGRADHRSGGGDTRGQRRPAVATDDGKHPRACRGRRCQRESRCAGRGAGYWSAENARPDGRVKTEFLIATTKDW